MIVESQKSGNRPAETVKQDFTLIFLFPSSPFTQSVWMQATIVRTSTDMRTKPKSKLEGLIFRRPAALHANVFLHIVAPLL